MIFTDGLISQRHLVSIYSSTLLWELVDPNPDFLHLYPCCDLCNTQYFPPLSATSNCYLPFYHYYYYYFSRVFALAKAVSSHVSSFFPMPFGSLRSVHTRADMPHWLSFSNKACFYGDHLSPLLCYFFKAAEHIMHPQSLILSSKKHQLWVNIQHLI